MFLKPPPPTEIDRRAAADHRSARRRLRKKLFICVIKSAVVFTYCLLLFAADVTSLSELCKRHLVLLVVVL
jgi:hypothetical protein